MAELTDKANNVFMRLKEEAMARKGSNENRRRNDRFEAQPKSEIAFVLMGQSPSIAKGTGCLINQSNGGLCMDVHIGIMDRQVIRLFIPVVQAKTTAPTLAEVRWTSHTPGENDGLRVGVKFL